MPSKQDKENIIKAGQTADLLVQDLRSLVRSDDLLLSELALEMVEWAVKIEQRLKRLEILTRR